MEQLFLLNKLKSQISSKNIIGPHNKQMAAPLVIFVSLENISPILF